MHDLFTELNLAKIAAKKAGDILQKNKIELSSIISTSNRDIKLKADKEAEELIIDILQKESKLPILAEESGQSVNDLGSTFWVVDPLDGTANYERNIPISCVSIALIKNLEPILGAVYDFNNDFLYEGSKYSVARMNEKIINTSKISKKNEGVLITGLPNNTDFSDQGLKRMIDDFQNWRKIRMIGSAAIACVFVASGKADLYKEKKTYLWDIAAGAAIVNAAGGKIKISKPNANFQVDAFISNGTIND